jgi:hypothetical protein
MASVNDNTLSNIHPSVTPHIYNQLQHVTCSSDTYRHNGGFLICKTGAHRAFLWTAKMTSVIVQHITCLFQSMINMMLQPTRYFNGF